jgi:hypothetical protein
MLISTDTRAIGNGYLIHDGEMTTLQELCKEIAIALDAPIVKTRIPYFLALIVAWVMGKWALVTKRNKRPLLTTYSVKNLGSRLEFSIVNIYPVIYTFSILISSCYEFAFSTRKL